MKLNISLIFFLQTISILVFPQKQNLKFEHLSTYEGLSQSNTLCIQQDSRGFMWFGTRDGLNKYDGYQFTVFKHNAQNPKSLSNNTISDIAEDSQGNLWIATWGGGVNRFDQAKEQFIHYKHDDHDVNTISSDAV